MPREQEDEENEEAGEPMEDPTETLDFPDGPGGILTDSDRVFLLHDHPDFPELEWDGDANQKRWRIRQKVKNALDDMRLVSSLDDKELELILDNVYVGEDAEILAREDYSIDDLTEESREQLPIDGWGEQYQHLLAMMQFAYRACNVVPLLTFEHLMEETVYKQTPRFRGAAPFRGGKKARNVNVDVSIDVNVEWEPVLDVEEIETKLERGEKLTREEVGELFLQGRIEPGDLGADDVDGELFRRPVTGSDELPGLDPSQPSPPDNWDKDLRERLPDGMAEKVDWMGADRPEEIWDQLEDHYDDPVGKATIEGDLP